MKKSVFISYRRSQLPTAELIAKLFQESDVECFLDRNQVLPLEEYPSRIQEAIARSHTMLIIWSHDYGESDHCLSELIIGWQYARKITNFIGDRIWIVNPEINANHIRIGELNSQNFLALPQGLEDHQWTKSCTKKLSLIDLHNNFESSNLHLAKGVAFNTPYPPAEFTGRLQELLGIHFNLHGNSNKYFGNALAVRTYGMGGIGKSTLAAAYARRFSMAYPGGIYWLNFSAYNPITADIDSASAAWLVAVKATLLGHPWVASSVPQLRFVDPETNLPYTAEQVHGRLAELLSVGRPYLWILDNVPILMPEDEREKILKLWCAPCGQTASASVQIAHTLITTRDARPCNGVHDLHLDVLEATAAFKLLSRFKIPDDGENAAVFDLISEVGAHTQALSLIGHRLRHASISYRNILESIRELGKTPRLESIANSLKLRMGKNASGIVSTFDISINSLDINSVRLLNIAGACAPNVPIPIELLALAFGDDSNNDLVDASLTTLIDASLLKKAFVQVDEKYDTVEIHPLLADFLVFRTEERAEEFQLVVMRALTRKVEDVKDPRKYNYLRNYMSHAHFLYEKASPEWKHRIGVLLAEYEFSGGNLLAAKKIGREVVRLAIDIYGESAQVTLSAMHNYSSTLGVMGEISEALRMQEKVLEGKLGKAPADEIVAALHSVANSLRYLDDLPKARYYIEIAYKIAMKEFGECDDNTIIAMNELASICMYQGEFHLARQLFERMISSKEILLKEHGDRGDNRNFLTMQQNLAMTLYHLEEYNSAKDILERIIRIEENMLPKDHQDIFGVKIGLASVLRKLGEKPLALEILSEVYATSLRKYTKSHQITMTIKSNLVNLYEDMGNLSLARELEWELLDDRTANLGEMHSDTLNTAWGLLSTSHVVGDMESAKWILSNTGLLKLLNVDEKLLSGTSKTIQQRLKESLS